MPRRSNPLTYLALAWLGLLALAAHANVPAPDGFGLAILALTFWSLGYLYYRLCRRWLAHVWLPHWHVHGLPQRRCDDVRVRRQRLRRP
jgi:hypothetical protein